MIVRFGWRHPIWYVISQVSDSGNLVRDLSCQLVYDNGGVLLMMIMLIE